MKNWWKNLSRKERKELVIVMLTGAALLLLTLSVCFVVEYQMAKNKQAEEINNLRGAVQNYAEQTFQGCEIVAYISCSKEVVVINVNTKEMEIFDITRNGKNSSFGWLLEEAYGDEDIYIYTGSCKCLATMESPYNTCDETRGFVMKYLFESAH